MQGVFDLFDLSDYIFCEVDQKADGNVIVSETAASGVFKIRDGMTQDSNAENRESDATLHIRPSETFLTELGGNIVGQGIKAGKEGAVQSYRIIGQVEGRDFDSGDLEFYRLTLKRESFASWQSQDLPLT